MGSKNITLLFGAIYLKGNIVSKKSNIRNERIEMQKLEFSKRKVDF